MGELAPNRLVKVDNWGIFFLQRLNHFYRKNFHCDLTLQFSTLDTIKSVKVHRLVLYACTDYFESLDIMNDAEHGQFLQLSNEMHPDVVIPIISFMYTGKLEFPVNLQSKLYEAAKKLRMTILTKLLDAQPKACTDPEQADDNYPRVLAYQHGEGPLEYSNNFENSQDSEDSFIPAVQLSQVSRNPTKAVEDPVITLTPLSAASSGTSQKANLKPDVTLARRGAPEIIPAKTNSMFKVLKVLKNDYANSNSKSKIGNLSLPPTLPGRKLPVWKRKVPFTGSQSDASADPRDLARLAELSKPRPTRFEWEENLDDPTEVKSVDESIRVLSHDCGPEILYPLILDGDSFPTREPSTSTVSSPPTPAPTLSFASESYKRSPSSPPESSPFKKSRTDLQDMKEYGKQQQLRNEIICNEDNEEDNDDTMDPDDLYGSCNEESQDNLSQSALGTSTPKPILKTVSKPECSPSASKRVRFSLEGKENNEAQSAETTEDFITSTPTPTATVAAKQTDSVLTKQKIVLPMDMNQIRAGGNHAKIVSEVLKKYPNLVRHNKNIKLKIMSKGSAAVPSTVQHAVEGDAGGGNKVSQSKVSYIYLKSENLGQFPTPVPEPKDKNEFDPENRTGPWLCTPCGTADDPQEFESYYDYRKHIVEVHGLKVDTRICEYCGLKNSKRNNALYHLYTKHGIEPPPHVKFPVCTECDYVALSEALFLKHKAVHCTKEELKCNVCDIVLTSHSAMQMHLGCDWHNRKALLAAGYPCPFCEDELFANGEDLKNHIERNHQSSKELLKKHGKHIIYRCPYCEALFDCGDALGKHIVEIHWAKKAEEQDNGNDLYELQSGQQLQYSNEVDQLKMDNQPSSELESLSNVASGIATSLNLVGNEQTVVYYEQHPESQDIGGEATIITGDDCRDYLIPEAVEDVGTGEHYQTMENHEENAMENEDSDSRASNTEEVNPVSCSDHDYSEPQNDEGIRQVIPLQSVSESYSTNQQIIQTILPDQRLVFSSNSNVVFQPSRINIPQRVLLAPGNMVLSQITHPGQNVILSPVIPQTRIILSNPLMQQTGNIIQDPNSTIVFANHEIPEQIQGIQAAQYPMQQVETDNQVEDSSDGALVLQQTQEMEDDLDKEQLEEPGLMEGDEMQEQQFEQGEEQDLEGLKGVEVNDMSSEQAQEMQELGQEEEEEEGEEEDEEEEEEEMGQVQEEEHDHDQQLVMEMEQEQNSQDQQSEELLVSQEEADKLQSSMEGGSSNIEEPSETSMEGIEEGQPSDDAQPTDEMISILNKKNDDARSALRVEPSKIVDDWDESNENQQNIESRGDGPSRPDFF